MRSCCGGKGLLHTAFLQQRCKRGRCVLLAAVAVKSQTTGIAAFPESGSECAGDQICTGIAGYSITDDFVGEQVENDAEIHPVVIDFEVCNIADPNLVWMVGSELALQQVLFFALLLFLVLLFRVGANALQPELLHDRRNAARPVYSARFIFRCTAEEARQSALW